jgi:quercetin dioxygenase-like cupin family protein
MPLLSRNSAPTFAVSGVSFVTLSSPSRGSTENSVWLFNVEPGTTGTEHQVSREETFIALRGRALVTVGGATHVLEAGNAFVVPADSRLSLSNPGTERFEAIAVLPVGGTVRVGDAPAFTPAWAA